MNFYSQATVTLHSHTQYQFLLCLILLDTEIERPLDLKDCSTRADTVPGSISFVLIFCLVQWFSGSLVGFRLEREGGSMWHLGQHGLFGEQCVEVSLQQHVVLLHRVCL